MWTGAVGNSGSACGRGARAHPVEPPRVGVRPHGHQGMLDVRRRTTVLFAFAMLAQVILVLAQVQSRSGVRVLSLVTFEVFSRIERVTFGVITGTRGVWDNYFPLRGVRAENESLRRQVADLEVRLQ